MASEERGSTSDASGNRKKEFIRLVDEVHISCFVLTNWIKRNYNGADVLTHLQNLAVALADEIGRIPPFIKSELPKLENETAKRKLQNISDSFERHLNELRSSNKSVESADEDVMLSIDSCLLEVRLLEKCLRNIVSPTSELIKDSVAKSLKNVLAIVARAEKIDIQTLIQEREPSRKSNRSLSMSDDDSYDERSFDDFY